MIKSQSEFLADEKINICENGDFHGFMWETGSKKGLIHYSALSISLMYQSIQISKFVRSLTPGQIFCQIPGPQASLGPGYKISGEYNPLTHQNGQACYQYG